MKQIKAIPKYIFDKNFTNKEFLNNNDACFISILDCDNIEQKYDNTIDNFLQVKMWDIEEDFYENGILKYEKATNIELQKIIDFVNKHRDKSNFIIHCSAGISRSGAVATYIKNKFIDEVNNQIFNNDNKNIQPNYYILKQLSMLDA